MSWTILYIVAFLLHRHMGVGAVMNVSHELGAITARVISREMEFQSKYGSFYSELCNSLFD